MTLSYLDLCRRLRFGLSPAQTVLARVTFDGADPEDLDGSERELARELFGDVGTIAPDLRKVVVLCKGARVGGTRMTALRTLHLALTCDLRGLAPGELGYVQIVGPDTRLAGQALSYVAGALRSDPALSRLVESESTEQVVIRREDGRRVGFIVLPATAGGSALRARTLVAALMTEAALFRDARAAVNDQECFRAQLPRLTVPGSQLLVESTPWGESGLVYDLTMANHGHPETCLVARCPTLLMRPTMAMRALVALERLRDPENAEREFDALFLAAGAGLFFERGLVDSTADSSASPLPSCPAGESAYAGADLGLVRDSSALVIVHRTDHGSVPRLRVAELVELRPQKGNPLDLREVVARFCIAAARHGVYRVHADHFLLAQANKHARELADYPPALAERARNVQFVPCAPKEQAFATVRDVLRAGALRMPVEFSELRAQMLRVTSQPTSGGGLKITMPRRGGSHGDACAALVVALAAACTAEAPIPLSVWREFAQASRAASMASTATSAGVGAMLGISGSIASLLGDAPELPATTRVPMHVDEVANDASYWDFSGFEEVGGMRFGRRF